jgi:AcrR family transcriptional regulator
MQASLPSTIKETTYFVDLLDSGGVTTLPDVPASLQAESAAPVSKGDRTRQRLLEIAIRRFASDGYRRTSVSDIAREAGVTPATTYAYFAGKGALFEAAVDADAASLIAQARASMTGGTARARWLPWIGDLVNAVEDHPLAARVLGGKEPDVIGRLLNLPSLRAVRTEVETDLRLGQASSEVRRDIDAAAVADGLETVVLALLMAYVQAGPSDDAAARAHGVMALLDAALRPPR